MAIENFGHGQHKAALYLDLDSGELRAVGVRQVLVLGAGEVSVELIEPIGREELLAVTTPAVEGILVSAHWLDDTHVRVLSRTTAGEPASKGVFWVSLYKVLGWGPTPLNF